MRFLRSRLPLDSCSIDGPGGRTHNWARSPYTGVYQWRVTQVVGAYLVESMLGCHMLQRRRSKLDAGSACTRKKDRVTERLFHSSRGSGSRIFKARSLHVFIMTGDRCPTTKRFRLASPMTL